MSTYFVCGCTEADGIRVFAACTEGHVETPAELPEPEPEPEPESPAEKKRIATASASLARGEDPKDTRTPAEKKADKKAAKA